MPNVLSPRDLVSRPDKMDETVPHICIVLLADVHLSNVLTDHLKILAYIMFGCCRTIK